MRRIALFLIVGAGFLLPAQAAYGTPITFAANLTDATEFPPPVPQGVVTPR